MRKYTAGKTTVQIIQTKGTILSFIFTSAFQFLVNITSIDIW